MTKLKGLSTQKGRNWAAYVQFQIAKPEQPTGLV